MGRDYQKDHLIFSSSLGKCDKCDSITFPVGEPAKLNQMKKVIFLFLKSNKIRVLSRINIKSDSN